MSCQGEPILLGNVSLPILDGTIEYFDVFLTTNAYEMVMMIMSISVFIESSPLPHVNAVGQPGIDQKLESSIDGCLANLRSPLFDAGIQSLGREMPFSFKECFDNNFSLRSHTQVVVFEKLYENLFC
ncbi:hypothetical protein PSDVSF_13530 [Pseudodesulfovibrio sediminis]|uniref:Uncharacterized protein n=1 Tax=Pseudodesulfovibrio sediminis TaxID=2810563 RepID=A0ABM9SE36_9BACT|nr:hypothetical protein PSDVSF_13530 [Pseudodesulfovibrio sediminis]